MDALADVLTTARLGGAVFARTAPRAPWGMAFAASPMAGFHIVVHGTCYLSVADGSDVTAELHQGDVVLLCHGSPHTVCSAQNVRARPFGEILRARTDPEADLVFGGNGASTVLVCGGYHFAPDRAHPLLDILPPLIHIHTAEARAGHDLALLIELLSREVARRLIGAETLTNRLVDALFVYVLRAWLEVQPDGTAGWLGALRDPAIGRALTLIHRQPAHPWSVESLAKQVARSRSGFAQRFLLLTGETPHRYLTKLRVDRAAQLLRDTDDSILQIAIVVGYANEQSLGKAFERRYQLAPGQYRRRHRQAAQEGNSDS
ncbi:MAG TPA: AraC family transcriptional regulator [Streptosporangiaceae bacterium]